MNGFITAEVWTAVCLTLMLVAALWITLRPKENHGWYFLGAVQVFTFAGWITITIQTYYGKAVLMGWLTSVR